MTDDPGMKEMLSFLIARDTMHQQQWFAVIEELDQPLPVPSDFSQLLENQDHSYKYFVHSNRPIPSNSRFAQSPSLDGKGEFSVFPAQPLGQTPSLASPPPEAHGTVMVKPQLQADGLTNPAHAGLTNDQAVQATQ